jgi:hypothetical protein
VRSEGSPGEGDPSEMTGAPGMGTSAPVALLVRVYRKDTTPGDASRTRNEKLTVRNSVMGSGWAVMSGATGK